MTYNTVIQHYDKLIDMDNDPVRDCEPLKQYMDTWDGQNFIDKMELTNDKTVLEVGVGTGRLAIRVAPLCKNFWGIDVSPKTIERAKQNLSAFSNISLICADFLTFAFPIKFDVIYSSLTFMHIEEKQFAFDKISNLLNPCGIFVLSIDKNQDKYIDVGSSQIEIYPDNPYETQTYIAKSNLELVEKYETDSAHIFVCLYDQSLNSCLLDG